MLLLLSFGCSSVPPSFFVTSVGNPNGGDYGGLVGADSHCDTLASEAGLPDQTWRAYLSTSAGPIHARDRIGSGPWFGVSGDMVAENLENLHTNGLPAAVRDELGQLAARGAPPGPEHDILTGSDAEGRVNPNGWTCGDWTSSSEDDLGVVGHLDWSTFVQSEWAESWNRVHAAPCQRAAMEQQRGSGRLYCFGLDQ